MPYKDKTIASAKAKERYRTNPEFRLRKQLNSRKNYNLVGKRKSHLKNTYGMTPEDYDILLTKQNGLCAICHNPPKQTPRFKFLQVDHSHKTGDVRGLLCFGCNRALGWYEYRQNAVKQYLGRL